MAKFNPDMPYGEVSPPLNGAMYWQAPNHFDANFNHIDHDTGKIIEQAEPKIRIKPGKEAPHEKRNRQQAELAARGKNPNTAAKEIKVGKVADNPNTGIDLLAWAEGKGPKGVNFFAVKNQMAKEGYDMTNDAMTAVQARELIKAKN